MNKKVLILCTGNSCRSIMAEAMVNHYLGNNWQAYSAGTAPLKVNQRTIQVMAEIGIDISGSRSKSVQEFINRNDLDLVITVCGNARENCPVFPNPVEQIHIGFDDPAPYTAQPDEIALPFFRKVRDEIKERLLGELIKR
ncbi:MAG: arsenate reductase ArsC [candidate division Zixibacteria bacterium]|nr:arsenate reductase ArsC [candidate division Zixibacteria bacterium]